MVGYKWCLSNSKLLRIGHIKAFFIKQTKKDSSVGWHEKDNSTYGQMIDVEHKGVINDVPQFHVSVSFSRLPMFIF